MYSQALAPQQYLLSCKSILTGTVSQLAAMVFSQKQFLVGQLTLFFAELELVPI